MSDNENSLSGILSIQFKTSNVHPLDSIEDDLINRVDFQFDKTSFLFIDYDSLIK